MAYKITFNNSAYMTAPELGNVVDGTVKKLRVVSDYVYWADNDGYWFSQAGLLATRRELGIWRNSTKLSLYFGGVQTVLSENVLDDFGSNIIDGRLEIELNVVNLNYEVTLNGEIVLSGAFVNGGKRLIGILFRIGARSNANFGTGGEYLLNTGNQVGDTRVYMDTGSGYVLEREYIIPASGVTISDSANSQDGTMRGTFSDSQFVEIESAPVLAATKALSGIIDVAFRRTLMIQSRGTATSWTLTGGADQAQYSLSNAGVLARTVPNPTEEAEVVTVTATNAAGTSNTQTVTITYGEDGGNRRKHKRKKRMIKNFSWYGKDQSKQQTANSKQ